MGNGSEDLVRYCPTNLFSSPVHAMYMGSRVPSAQVSRVAMRCQDRTLLLSRTALSRSTVSSPVVVKVSRMKVNAAKGRA